MTSTPLVQPTPAALVPTASSVAARFGSFASVACGFVAAAGGLVLVGWALDLEQLKTLFYPHPVAMNPATAVTFLLCAAALWLKRDERRAAGTRGPAVANACAAAAAAVGVVVLTGQFGGWDAGVDEWLFRRALESRTYPNRMAPNTALNFVLTGLALLLLDVETAHGRRPAQALTLVATCVSLLALVGHALTVLEFYGVPSRVPMALNTAVCFTVLCAGTLCARLGREPMATIVSGTAGGVVARRLLPAAFGVPLLLGWLRARGDAANLYEPALGLSLFALGNIVAFNLLVWWTARLLYRLDERRRAAEEQLHAQNQRLAQAVRAEHEALQALKDAQGQLVQTEKLAGLGQMVAGVAHEINNPLAFVSNNVAVLRRDVAAVCDVLALHQDAGRRAEPALAAACPDLLAAIRERSEQVDLPYTLAGLPGLMDRSRDGLNRIKRIVEDLRNFARLDEGDLHEVDLNEGVRSTAGVVGPRAAARGVRVELDLSPLPPVACYPGKINQVVMNLLANAIDASPPGGVVTARTAPDGPRARLDVTDHGSGIDPAVRGRIFDPFFTTKPVGQGTGLGLSISYRVVTEHGGTIEVDSTPGKGSRFTVLLPCGRPC